MLAISNPTTDPASVHNSCAATQLPKPSLPDRWARRAVLGLMQRFDRSPLRVRLWDGEEFLFGRADSAKDTAEMDILHPGFFRKVLFNGEIGFGEAYMDGDWRTPDLTRLLAHLIDNLEHIPEMSGSRARSAGFHLLRRINRLAHWRRRNNRRNSRRNIREHYDLSNDFYMLWLDSSLTYSSAWFEGNEPLEHAQENKYRRLCQKLQLKPGQQVLEIGCGWGGFSIFAARHYGVQVTAITISDAQFQMARERVQAAGLANRIDVRLCDYRDVQGQFDAIASIEMIEAVGHQYLRSYFAQCNRLLKPNGRLGLQVIICPDSRYDMMRRSVDWIKKHIFPGGQLPSIKALIDSAHSTGDLYLQHLENFGLHYARTLRIWRDSFNARHDAIRQLGFDEVFLRKWNYYLAYCEAAFATRNINVSQLVLCRPNNREFAIEP